MSTAQDSRLDMRLEDIISEGPRRGGRGGRGRGTVRGRGRGARRFSGNGAGSQNPLSRENDGPIRRERTRQRAAPYQARERPSFDESADWRQDKIDSEKQLTTQKRVQSESSVLITNLDKSVNEGDLEDIFKEYQVKSVQVFYDKEGQSTGQAEVTFSRKGDAEKVSAEYDGAEVDGRPMNVKVIASVSTPKVVRKPERPAPPGPARNVVRREREQRAPRGGRGRGRGGNAGGAPRGAGGAPRGAGRGGRSAGGAPPKEADLDAEMEAYQKARKADA